MEYFKAKRIAGLINTKNCDRMTEIVNHMEKEGYSFIEEIGRGSFGTILKVKDNGTNEELAVKVVQKCYATEGETALWENLIHQHILKLKDFKFVYHADTCLFITDVYPKNLEQAILESSFRRNKNASTQVIGWLAQILEAVNYLHGRNLSHNDIKLNNVLISSQNCAVVSDFGFLCSAEKPIRKYGVPFIYRCPEGRMTESGLTEIDGKKLDIWCIGIMLFEIFTRMLLLKRFSTWEKRHLNSWYTQVYPIIQNSLQKENFVKIMADAFPACKRIQKVADLAMDFIISCLNIVPDKRPLVQELKDHKIFGGTFKYTDDPVNIWKNKVSIWEFNITLQQNKIDLIPETEVVKLAKSDCGDNIFKANGETYDVDSDVLPELDISYPDSASKVPHLKRLYSSHDLKTNSDIALIPVKSKESTAAASHQNSSFNISEEDLAPVFRLLFDSPVCSPASVIPSSDNASELDKVPIISQCSPTSRRKRLIQWWKQKKASFLGFITGCCACARKVSHTDD